MYPPFIPQKMLKYSKIAPIWAYKKQQKKPVKTLKSQALTGFLIWSERQDLNLRPLPPQGINISRIAGNLLFVSPSHPP